MKCRNTIKVLLLIILASGFATTLYSQKKPGPAKTTGVMNLTVVNDLSFGDVFMGYTGEVQHNDADAAKFSFSHTFSTSQNMLFEYSLPANISYSGDDVPITFDVSHTAWSYSDSPTGRTTYNPAAQLYIPLVPDETPVYLWLGGSISPGTSIAPGTYEGTITLTVIFL